MKVYADKMCYNVDNALHNWLQANIQQTSTFIKSFTDLMQKMGDQITKSIDKQMDYMTEMLGLATSMRSSASKEPFPLSINPAPQLSYANVKVLSHPLLLGFMTNFGSRMFEHGFSTSNQTG